MPVTRNLLWIGVVVGGLSLTSWAWATDRAKEARWAEQVTEALLDGEAERLEAGGESFLAIYTPAERPRGAVILLHGLGVHPDWPQVVHPLRVGLPERGWSTLSVQMPVLPNEATAAEYAPLYGEVAPRLDVAQAFLEKRRAGPIALVGHSLGASMGAYYLASGARRIVAFVGIGMSAGGRDPRMDDARSLARIRVPVLDLYGSRDLPGVLATAVRRETAAAGNPRYTRLQVPDADHFFDGADEVLVGRVSDWLDRNALEGRGR